MDAQFWTALVQIIGLDIVLSGDNAVVIALACRRLPPRQQRIGIMVGSLAAVGMRVLFALVVTWLMGIPMLKIVGGLLLFWIGWKLLAGDEAEGEGHVADAGSLWGALRTIMVADAVMSLDNVIAVAAAAKGSAFLLALGLLISIPLVVFGATFLLRMIDRFPIIVTIGAALIGYVAGEVIIGDILVRGWVDANAHWLHWVAPAAGAAGLVAAADLRLRRVPVPETAGEAIAAPAAVFGARMVLSAAAAFVAAKFAVDGISSDAWWHAAAPAVAAAIAVAGVELAARTLRAGRQAGPG
jgi:YjbE family integral membrane protein